MCQMVTIHGVIGRQKMKELVDNQIGFRCIDEMRFKAITNQEAINLGQSIKQHEFCVNGKKVAKGPIIARNYPNPIQL